MGYDLTAVAGGETLRVTYSAMKAITAAMDQLGMGPLDTAAPLLRPADITTALAVWSKYAAGYESERAAARSLRPIVEDEVLAAWSSLVEPAETWLDRLGYLRLCEFGGASIE